MTPFGQPMPVLGKGWWGGRRPARLEGGCREVSTTGEGMELPV